MVSGATLPRDRIQDATSAPAQTAPGSKMLKFHASARRRLGIPDELSAPEEIINGGHRLVLPVLGAKGHEDLPNSVSLIDLRRVLEESQCGLNAELR